MYNAYYAICVCGQVSTLRSEHLAGLLCDTNEGGSPAQLFELGGAHIGAGGAKAPQHISDSVLHISSIGNLHCPPLRRPGSRAERGESKNKDILRSYWTEYLRKDISRRIGTLRSILIDWWNQIHDISLSPILSNSTHVSLHGGVGAHAIEEFVFLAILLNDLSGALVVACKHSSHHYKVSPCTWGAKAEKSCR